MENDAAACESSADVMTAMESHGAATPRIRVMRGQVVVRELVERSALWMPDDKPREVHTHRGVVLAMGEPAFLVDRPPTVPFGFDVGDVVQYHFTHHQEAWTMPWPPDGKPATWIAQANVDGVWS